MKTLGQFLTEVGMTVISAPGNNSGFKEKAIVAQHKVSKKRYTFDTKEEAEKHFGKDQWHRMQSHDSWNIRAGISEAKNTPSVKSTTSASGQPAWKAMNKHGKTKWFNNEDSAYKHAGIEKPA